MAELQASQKGLVVILAAGLSAWIWWLKEKSRKKLPPGSFWSLPFLGETLSYVRDPLGFIEELSFRPSSVGPAVSLCLALFLSFW